MSDPQPTPEAQAAATTPDHVPTPVEVAEYEAYNAGAEPLSEAGFVPTCMIWTMFIGLGVMILVMLLWVLTTLGSPGI